MEHKQLPVDVSSSAPSMYCSTVEEEFLELHVEDEDTGTPAEEPKSSQQWTTIDNVTWTTIDSTTESDDGRFMRVLPGGKALKYSSEMVRILKQIAEGGQGTIHTADILSFNSTTREYERDEDAVSNVVAKLFKSRNHGQWPEEVFDLHVSCPFICRFFGYCMDGDSFYLLMKQYHGSLRAVIDKHMESHGGKPLPDKTVLTMIIHIALGMRFLHENNVIHRDLKADNVFVNVTQKDELPWKAYIGDFDVASNVVGTLFWRAPEVLQALKDGKRPVFTPKADVYSYAMTCYELLTGRIPFEGFRASDYDVVLSGKRPKLPSDLNPKVGQLISRCWHQNPDARPMFSEIVVELRGLLRELVDSQQVYEDIDWFFEDANNALDITGAGPEDNLDELRQLFPRLLVKYKQDDTLLLGSEVVDTMEQFHSQFGLQSFKQKPTLPFAEWTTRDALFQSFIWKMLVFLRTCPKIVELRRINRLMANVLAAMNEDLFSEANHYVDKETPTEAELAVRAAHKNALAVEQARLQKRLVLPDGIKHDACVKQIHHGSPTDEFQACDLCKGGVLVVANEDETPKYFLYVDNASALTKIATSICSSLKANVGALF